MKNKILMPILMGLLFLMTPYQEALTQPANPSFHTINGVVQDARNNKGIAFASVYIPGTTIGTVANLDGEFTIKIQKTLDVDHFSISHLGYHVAEFPVKENLGYGKIFTLQPHSVDLPEVTIRPSDPLELVKSAIDKIDENYPLEPHKLTGFYREAIRQRRDYVSISEAIVDIYQAPYAYSYESDRMKIVRGRKSGDVKKADTLIVKLQGGPHVSMLLDIVKNPSIILSRETLIYYDYEFLDVVKIDGETNYVIGFEPKLVLPFPLYEGRLYISVENLAFTMAEFSLDLSNKRKAAPNFILKRPAGLRFTPLNTNYLVTYKEIDGKYHVNYVRSELEFFADWRRRIFRTNFNVMAEMAITERQSENVSRMPARESFRPNTILSDMVPVYFEDEFWGEYNYIEPEESIESAIQKINQTIER